MSHTVSLSRELNEKTILVSPQTFFVADTKFFNIAEGEEPVGQARSHTSDTRVIIMNQEGEVFTGFDNPHTRNPIFRQAGHIDRFNKTEALLKDPGYTKFYDELDEVTKESFDNCVFVRIVVGKGDMPINTRSIMGGCPSVLSFVSDAEDENHPSVRVQRRGVYFNNMTQRLQKPLNAFKQTAHEFLMGTQNARPTTSKRHPA